jgi:Ca2+-binding RTX toxin-like protein
MSARTISAAVCTALALTLASAIPALAHGNTGNNLSLQAASPCPRDPGTPPANAIVDGGANDNDKRPHYIKGTNGPDTIWGTNEGDTIEGLGGDDIICGFDGPDSIEGGPGADTIDAGKGNDYVEGEGSGDTIYGGPGADTLLGHPGDDTIYANDQFNANDNAKDTINGGGGNNDICYYTPTTDPTTNDTATECEVTHTP